MAVGIRIRGGANQMQISDEAPTYMIVCEGFFNAANKILSAPPGGTDYVFSQRVMFPFTITSPDPPLIFADITNTIVVSAITILGSPGAWTGFLIDAGIGVHVEYSAVGSYFACTSVVPKSNDPIGIRIRNKLTNEIIFDTGYRLAKFMTYLTSCRPSTQAEQFRWQQYGEGQEFMFQVGSRQPGYILLNCLMGRFSDAWTGRDPGTIYGVPRTGFGFDANYPNELFFSFWSDLSVDISQYKGLFTYATKGN